MSSTFLEKCVAGGLDAAAITDLILAVASITPYAVMPIARALRGGLGEAA